MPTGKEKVSPQSTQNNENNTFVLIALKIFITLNYKDNTIHYIYSYFSSTEFIETLVMWGSVRTHRLSYKATSWSGSTGKTGNIEVPCHSRCTAR